MAVLEALLILSILLPFVAGAGALLLGRALGLRTGWLVAAAAAGSTWCLARLAWSPAAVPAIEVPWMPSLGVALALRADGFGLFFALLVSAIGVLVALYSLGYLGAADADRARRYYAALAVFMGSMIGIALADDLILLFVFWEMTSVSSFLLIGHRFEDEDTKRGAVTALQVTALGGLVMSVGFLLIGQVTGTFSLHALASDPAHAQALLASPLGACALVCVLVGAFTKSAQVPFHFWLPQAMVAPTPVSAYLHAATMVKAGVFLIGRMAPLFGAAPLWGPLLAGVGGVSMVLGAYQAAREDDLKAILARTTGSTLGMLFLLYGIGAVGQDALQMLNHALYKGALFLVAGIVDHHAHTRDLRRLGGLRHALPVPFAIAAVAAGSMAGLPPLLGFVVKESLLEAVLHAPALAAHPVARGLVLAALLATGALLVATALRFVIGVFLGPAPRREHRAHGVAALAGPPLVLAAGALGLGLATPSGVTARLATLASSVPDAPLDLALAPHLGVPLALSVSAIVLGILAYRARERLAGLGGRSVLPPAATIWRSTLDGVMAFGEAYSRRWENGSLRWYLAGTMLTLPLVVWWACTRVGVSYRAIGVGLQDLSLYGALYCGLLVLAAAAAARARTRLAAAIASSTVGFLVAMVYVVYRSPDILLTQILIETVSTIFILLLLVHLPRFPAHDLGRAARLLNAGIAGSVGLAVTVLLLLAMTPGLRETDNLATRPGGLLSLALAEGGGANAVNVIIVDIRALDTSGEITVLVVVGLCIFGLLRARRRPA
jgi:NADH:ubiquinone oxidoreductase subunit 5 (subunit L)/multisubunit Na+/H+ antiporter MnhA subunit